MNEVVRKTIKPRTLDYCSAKPALRKPLKKIIVISARDQLRKETKK